MKVEGRTVKFCKKEKKNGAHNHLSHLKELGASKYSRHVVLCKKTQKTIKHKQKIMIVYCSHGLKILFVATELSFKKRKKTEHTIMSSHHEQFKASKYSRHVVLCKNSTQIHKTT